MTLFPVPSPTPTPLPPSPTPSPVPPPQATPTPLPPDDRYGVILHTTDPAQQGWFLAQLGASWFIDGGFGADIPLATNKLMFVGSLPGINSFEDGPTPEELADVAAANPGLTWLIANEPNRRPGYDPDSIVHRLHDIYSALKTADPTAKIVSPPLLNWLFTCTNCPGFGRGTEWAEAFRIKWFLEFGEEPPVDIWAVNAYPLDWLNTPTLNPDIVIGQVSGLRQWLNERPYQASKPIWVTEIGLHWGWDAIDFSHPGCNGLPFPIGTYREDGVLQYQRTIYDWLEANAESMNIERWFQYISYHEIATCNTDGYAGLTLFDGPKVGAGLTRSGQLLQARILHLK